MAAIEVQEGDRAAAAIAKTARQAGKGRRAVPKGMPATEVKRRTALYDVAIVKWKSEQERFKATSLAMANAGREPCKYWYMEADDPENIAYPNPPLIPDLSGTSCPHCHAQFGVIHSDSSAVDMDGSLYMQGQ